MILIFIHTASHLSYYAAITGRIDFRRQLAASFIDAAIDTLEYYLLPLLPLRHYALIDID